APGAGLGCSAAAAGAGSAAARRQTSAVHPHQHAGGGFAGLVRQGPAGPESDGAGPRSGLPLPVPEDLLRGSRESDGRQQPAAAGHRHAARALGARGTQTRRIPASGRHRASGAAHPPAGVRPLRADRPRTPERRGVRRLRTRYGELPRLRQRTDADGAPRTGRVGSAVSAGVHLARLAGEARVLEGCALTVAPGRRRHRALATDGSLERNLSSRRSIMTLFSAPNDPWSHRTRIVLAEKGDRKSTLLNSSHQIIPYAVRRSIT